MIPIIITAVTEYFKNLRVCRVFVFVWGIHTISQFLNTILRLGHQQSRPTHRGEIDSPAIYLISQRVTLWNIFLSLTINAACHLPLADLHSCPLSMRTANVLFMEGNNLGLHICAQLGNSFLSLSELTCGSKAKISHFAYASISTWLYLSLYIGPHVIARQHANIYNKLRIQFIECDLYFVISYIR